MFYFKFWGEKTFVQTPLPQIIVTFALIGFLSILIGLVAEMLNRTYHESQNKPVYIVKNTRNLGWVNHVWYSRFYRQWRII
jgi:hypothetical protein